ncbi:MAG TPA: IS21 family transposase [Pirellulales bacterium]|nr:IS21 family transposase [Pirellulales bacterium]
MANQLKMADVQAILSLHAQGWPQVRIAELLSIDRGTVRKYLRQALCGPKPANAPTGSADEIVELRSSKPALFSASPGLSAESPNAPIGAPAPQPGGMPADGTGPPGTESAGSSGSKPANLPTGSWSNPGPASQCEAHRELIAAKLAEGLTYQRILQDLADAGVHVHYDALRRFCRRLAPRRVLPVRRMECGPGEEAQVDFGSGARIITADGKRRKTHVFRIVLSHSRKGYSEATFTQTTDDFLTALENAFRHFGGVPKTLVIDNLKAAVAHPDWFDPELTPKVRAFAEHYGTVILPARPYKPEHKGKIEAGVKYVKNNALKGRVFATLDEQQRHLDHWELSVADTRIHGTTKRQVSKLFAEAERPALQPLPPEGFSNFREAQRKVNRDGHVEVAKAYYSAPPEYLGRTVWVRWDARLVRLFNHRFELIATHTRKQPGRFSTLGEHLPTEKVNSAERGVAYLLGRVEQLGPQSHAWAQAMLHARGVEGIRVLQGLLALGRAHAANSLEKACEIALSHGEFHLRTVRKLIERSAPVQTPLPFLEEHPIIRPLADYARLVRQAIHRQENRSGTRDSGSVSEGFTRHDWAKERPGEQAAAGRGAAEVPPPRSGYPSPGCPSAEPGSVSPDTL